MKKGFYKGIAMALTAVVLVGCSNVETGGTKTSTATKLHNIINIGASIKTINIPEVKTITLTATGDCTLGAIHSHSYDGSFHAYYDNYGETYFFDKVRPIFQEDDFTLINLECVLTDSTARVEKTFSLKGKESYTGIMTSSSVEGCTLGNNHSSDYGPESLTDTQAALEKAGIVYGYNEEVAYYTTEDDLVIAVVSTSLLSTAREPYLYAGIEEAKEKGANLIIAAVHWGIEGDHHPTSYQRETGKKLIDAGADVVIGNHPHVLQGMEEYKGKIICYSLGNFSFGGNKNPSDKNTAIYQQTFTFVDGEIRTDIDAKIYPCKLSGHSGCNDFQPMVVEGDVAASIISKMNQYSAPYSGVRFDDEGTLILTKE